MASLVLYKPGAESGLSQTHVICVGLEIMSGYQEHDSGIGGRVVVAGVVEVVVVVVVVATVVSTGISVGDFDGDTLGGELGGNVGSLVGTPVGLPVAGTGLRVGGLVGTLNNGVGIRSTGGGVSPPKLPPLLPAHSGKLRFLGLLHFLENVLENVLKKEFTQEDLSSAS